jgi:hypothetical protein
MNNFIADPQKALRRRFKQYYKDVEKICKMNKCLERKHLQKYQLDARGLLEGNPIHPEFDPIPIPPYPPEFHKLRCGAKTKRTEQPCKQKTLYANGRCKFHGGMSTGPRTTEGKRRSALNGLRPKQKRSS